MSKELTPVQLIERSIIKKYRKSLWNPFIAGVKRYELIKENDKIAVCISGGKDGMLLAKLMQHLQKFSDIPFEVIFLSMDPGYNTENRKLLESNAKLLEIPVTIFETNIFNVADKTQTGSPCYLCARMRRGHLYSKAKELGCNKIALGHHMSDVIETTLMGMLYGSQIQGMPPKLKSTNFDGMELIRPLFCVNENDIIAWKNYNNLRFLECACKMTEGHKNGSMYSKRSEMKDLIKELKTKNKDIEKCIFAAIHNVQVDTFVEYKLFGERHTFLEKFK